MHNLKYFNISWNSTKDGKGIRTVIYLQACNLQCPWCHSPHSQYSISPILLNSDNCKFCKKCLKTCAQNVHFFEEKSHKIDITKCISCRECINNCNASISGNIIENALFIPTKEEKTKLLLKRTLPQLKLLKNIGGITISGGEPMLQYKGLYHFLKDCKDIGIHTCVETSASVPFHYFRHIYTVVDEWLFGLRPLSKKSINKVANYSLVTENLKKLAKLNNKNITIRTPVINNVVDSIIEIEEIVKVMKENQLSNIELLPYNPYTTHYYDVMGINFNKNTYKSISNSAIKNLIDIFNKNNIYPQIIK